MNQSSFPNSSRAYADALAYLATRIDYERAPPVPPLRDFKLDRMRRLLTLLGNPEQGLRIVHVAGTKGKGSTATMIAEVLRAAGLRTGLFTSPHLTAVEQRWMVDGQVAPAEELPILVEIVRRAADELDAQADLPDSLGRPTFFELTTAIGLVHFRRQQCQAAVLEVGLGGRLDATNVCQPEATVITTISFDHTKLLGDTLGAIAGEKAGIIKPGIPCVVGVRGAEPRQVIEARAREVGAPVFGIDVDFDVQTHANSAGVSGASLTYRELGGVDYQLADVRLAMHGEHQALNGAIAIATLRTLVGRGWDVSEEAIRQGLSTARCPARVEVFAGPPVVIVDAAHNVASVESLVRVLEQEFAGRPGRLIFAASADKDVFGMLERLAPKFAAIYLTRFVDNPRSVPPAQLAGIVSQLREKTRWRRNSTGLPRPTVWENPVDAWREARRDPQPDEFICVAGSFFLAAELRPLVIAACGGGAGK